MGSTAELYQAIHKGKLIARQYLVFLRWALKALCLVPSREKKPAPCALRARFGKNVARLRVARGLTQQAFAEKIEKSVRYTQSIEAGEYWPALPTLAVVRKTLKCTWDELLAGT
jgi:ribosome-binding protein aMBF1 (putative translation factor)